MHLHEQALPNVLLAHVGHLLAVVCLCLSLTSSLHGYLASAGCTAAAFSSLLLFGLSL